MNQYTKKWNNDDLSVAIKNSRSWKDVCQKLNMIDHSSNVKRLRTKALELGLDLEHFKWKHKYNPEMLANAVRNSFSYAGVLRLLGMNIFGSAYPILKREIKKQKLDTSHFLGKKIGFSKMILKRQCKDISEHLVENSSYCNGSSLKNRLLREKIISNECCMCGNKGLWKGKKLVMVLDHINGTHNDNRIENLRMLCPNCNSQQPTFCRKK